jgi:hypothetical protein
MTNLENEIVKIGSAKSADEKKAALAAFYTVSAGPP